MPLWLRRTIYLSFIALFLLVAPILSLYSMGYRYHWGKHRIERTGLLIVTGEPRDATVRIDDAIRARRLPARIGGLNENEYTVRIEQEGFHPWEQRIVVTSGQTTFITDAVLFRNALPTLSFEGAIAAASVSADGEWLAFIRTAESFEELWMRRLASGEQTLTLRTPRPRSIAERSAIAFFWSPRDATLLIITPTDVLAINPRQDRTPRSLARLLPRHPTLTAWEIGSANTIIAVAEGRLHRLHFLTERAIALAVATPIGPFAVARGTIFAGTDGAVTVAPTDGGAARVIATVRGAITAFTDLRGSTLYAEAQPNQILDINTTTGNVRTRVGNGLRWDSRGERALWYGSPFELWGESGNQPQPQLIARRDTTIVDALWLPQAPYVLLAAAHDITAVDSNAPARAPIVLANFDDIRSIAAPPTGASLLIVGRRGTTDGLWSLPIR